MRHCWNKCGLQPLRKRSSSFVFEKFKDKSSGFSLFESIMFSILERKTNLFSNEPFLREKVGDSHLDGGCQVESFKKLGDCFRETLGIGLTAHSVILACQVSSAKSKCKTFLSGLTFKEENAVERDIYGRNKPENSLLIDFLAMGVHHIFTRRLRRRKNNWKRHSK